MDVDDPSTVRPCSVCASSHAVLFWLASLIWFVGVWATEDTATTLVTLALSQGASVRDAYIAYGIGGVAGLASGFFLFSRLARANVERIAALREPRLYDCFRPHFVVWLCVFDGGTILLQTYVAKDATSRLAMGAVNFAVCVSLATSLLYILWLWRMFVPGSGQTGLLSDAATADEKDFTSLARGLISP